MARHTIRLPDLMQGRELRTIIWDSEAGTLEGDHSDIEYLRRTFAAPKPVTRGYAAGVWHLQDPAHDPAEFLIDLWLVYDRIEDEPLRSTLPAIFDGIEIREPDVVMDILYDGHGNVMT